MAVDLKLLVEQCRQEAESDADRSRARVKTQRKLTHAAATLEVVTGAS